jgi:hypothetical protein
MLRIIANQSTRPAGRICDPWHLSAILLRPPCILAVQLLPVVRRFARQMHLFVGFVCLAPAFGGLKRL